MKQLEYEVAGMALTRTIPDKTQRTFKNIKFPFKGGFNFDIDPNILEEFGVDPTKELTLSPRLVNV